MGNFYDGELDLSKPDPIHTWEAKCPHCHQRVYFIDNSKAPDYWKDIAEERLKQLKQASEYIKKIDAWCFENIGNSYLGEQLRKLHDKYKNTGDKNDKDNDCA